jgi:hypothetical protein
MCGRPGPDGPFFFRVNTLRGPGSSFFIFTPTGEWPGVMRNSIIIILLPFLTILFSAAYAQEKDSTLNKILDNKIAKELLESVTRKQPLDQGTKNIKSEDVFMVHQGKIIRNIYIRRITFERSIYDTAKSIRNTVTRIADKLHKDTRSVVIRNNLFFRENRPLNPYRLADNERYLRDLDFILDSKIRVLPVKGTKDSVDVEVVTRDVFSLGARAKIRGIDRFSIGVYDANLMGLGQRLQGEFLFDRERDPIVGTDFRYSKSSIGGSLANLSVGYTELNNSRSAGEENEYAFFVRLSRPLVSPYSRMAGEIEVSRNWSVNVFELPDSLFRSYGYNAQDYWIGYNIGIKNNMNDRSRHFVALRYSQQHFNRQPDQESQRTRLIYNDNRFLLGELIFYNQNFYKTNYVFGFGRTEDIPYGQTITLTAGWSEDIGLRRFYTGASAIKRIVRPSGRFYDMEAGAGTFFNEDKTEDGVLFVRGAYYTKLYEVGKSKVRHQFGGGYARAFNNRVRELLTINRELRGFGADSTYGYQRFNLRSETTVFTPVHFLGFRFAPFLSLEGAYLTQKRGTASDGNIYLGSTGGVRIRNENLIFGTIELRAFFYPKTVPGVESVSFKVTTNVRIKYSGSFVSPPDYVRYN